MKLAKVLVSIVVVLVVIQFIPYGKDHTNPKVLNEVKWDSPKTKEIFTKACADCHSNNTKWPSYSNIAPISWLVQFDVDEGREHFNVSMWNRQSRNEGDEAAGEVREGEMPPLQYTINHPEAKLSADETQQLIKGLINTFGDE